MKLTKLETLKAKVYAVEILEDKIETMKRYDIRKAEEGEELDEYDKKNNDEVQNRINQLQYVIEEIAN